MRCSVLRIILCLIFLHRHCTWSAYAISFIFTNFTSVHMETLCICEEFCSSACLLALKKLCETSDARIQNPPLHSIIEHAEAKSSWATYPISTLLLQGCFLNASRVEMRKWRKGRSLLNFSFLKHLRMLKRNSKHGCVPNSSSSILACYFYPVAYLGRSGR